MQNKYYTPEIEDLFVGYECELNIKGKWINHIIGKPDSFMVDDWYKLSIEYCENNDNLEKYTRTLYLTKEQIEVEGWEFTSNDGNELCFKHPKKLLGTSPIDDKYLILFYNVLSHRLYIYLDWISIGDSETLFTGECKSINEFRKIISYLEIEK